MPSARLRAPLLVLALGGAAALSLSACSSSPSKSAGTAITSYNTGSGPSATTSTVGPSGTIPAADLSPVGAAGSEPQVTVPSDPPPTGLRSADLIAGNGAAAVAGNTVTVQYVLATYSSHKVIQSSWTSQPFTFTLGVRQVIPGWDEGLMGMKVGGRRELIIPSTLGYAGRSPGPGIAANDTLVFVIDLLKIN
jgi:peptidylprolyl isomerase